MGGDRKGEGRAEVLLLGLPHALLPHESRSAPRRVSMTAPLAERLLQVDVDREARRGKQPFDPAPVWLEVRG